MQKQIEYRGETYHLQSSKRYYQSGNKDSKTRLLHRKVWEDNCGPIPPGFEVHHTDEDWTNNSIGNLECLPMLVHQRQHMAKRFAEPGYREQVAEYLKEAQEKAKVWHASPEGLAWHSKHGKETWINRKTTTATCTVCSKTYETFHPERSRFCSHACEQVESYQRHKTATGACLVCGKEYVYNKYRKQECCSRDCSNKLRGLRQRGLAPQRGDVVTAPTVAGY